MQVRSKLSNLPFQSAFTLPLGDRAYLELLIVSLRRQTQKTIPPELCEDVLSILYIKILKSPKRWLTLPPAEVAFYAIRAADNIVRDIHRARRREAGILQEYRYCLHLANPPARRGAIPITESDVSRFTAGAAAILFAGPGRRLGAVLVRAARAFGFHTRLDQLDFSIAYLNGPMPTRFGISRPKITRWITAHSELPKPKVYYEARRLSERLKPVRDSWRARLRRTR